MELNKTDWEFSFLDEDQKLYAISWVDKEVIVYLITGKTYQLLSMINRNDSLNAEEIAQMKKLPFVKDGAYQSKIIDKHADIKIVEDFFNTEFETPDLEAYAIGDYLDDKIPFKKPFHAS